MKIVRLHLSHFRNLHETTLEPHPRFNVIHGDNAQGKTNLLEAVFLLATLKSFQGARNTELIAWDEDTASAEAVVSRRDVERTFNVSVSRAAARTTEGGSNRGGRVASVDGKRIQRLSEYFGHFNVVLFTPDDLAITKGEPARRRRYLDRAVFNADASHFDLVRDYAEALRNRNALLRTSGGASLSGVIEAFDEPMARLSARVIVQRCRYLRRLVPAFRSAFSAVTGGEREISIRYRSSVEKEQIDFDGDTDDLGERDDEAVLDTLTEQTRLRLAETLATDLNRGYTSVGPHMDDLVAVLEGHALRRFGSQGQHRAFVLSLKVAEIIHLHEVLGFRPILLLDDVSSELDKKRGARFMALVRERGGQVFITTTDKRHIRTDEETRVWHIDKGTIREEDETLS